MVVEGEAGMGWPTVDVGMPPFTKNRSGAVSTKTDAAVALPLTEMIFPGVNPLAVVDTVNSS